jgi:hypothetical protein
MTKPPNVDDELGAQGRFDRAIKNALAMPHKAHGKPGQDRPNAGATAVRRSR